MKFIFFFIVLIKFSQYESTNHHHQKHVKQLYERGVQPPIPDIEIASEAIGAFKDPLKSSSPSPSQSKSPSTSTTSKKLLHPKKLFYKLGEQLYREIDNFHVSDNNNFSCSEMLEIFFNYKDLEN